jgi:hypothetical protein
LYQPGAANTAYIEWTYVSCSKTPGSPQTSGSCPYCGPGFACARGLRATPLGQ